MCPLSFSSRCAQRLVIVLSVLALSAPGRLKSAETVGDPVLDFRYAPTNWQTAICLPDDWQKTLVGKDGALLYDYPGPFAGFGTRITFDTEGGTRWLTQELVSPRVPIVRTTKRAGVVELTEEAFAVPPDLMPKPPGAAARRLSIERVGKASVISRWAQPPKGADPAFADIAVGYNEPVRFRFKTKPGEHFTVVFGLCEGWHTNAAQRILELEVEGQMCRSVDLVGEYGRNVPAVFAFEAMDENGDGWVDLAVAPAAGSPDRNAILNLLWVFPPGTMPASEQLIAGQVPTRLLGRVDCGSEAPNLNPPRCDVLLVRLHNPDMAPARVAPILRLESAQAVALTPSARIAEVGHQAVLFSDQPWPESEMNGPRTELRLASLVLPPRATRNLVFTAARRGAALEVFPRTLAQAQAARKAAERYWRKTDLPYGRIEVPDPAAQALLDSCVRNIYQAREIKHGLPAFQVGPTCYRGLWVVDGSFLLEAVTYLGRTNETRAGVKYLLGFQRPDGGFMLIDGHWKETGIALWAVARHARLTGDRAWLRSVWPAVQRGFAQIQAMRNMPAAGAPNEGLIPDGFSDGGLADRVPEYTNVYWTLAGMRAAIEAARWLGNQVDAVAWQRAYDDFYAVFRRAAERDSKLDGHGNRYLPIRMTGGDGVPPQKAQWAFLHALFPGQVFQPRDPLVTGNLAMLRAVECEGLVRDTGWLKDGIWSYFGSFYAHAWLWLGDGGKSARTMYAFANHASPLLCWREEQMPVGEGTQMVGDMPHNWASAEFIRLVRHSIALERDRELHLFEGFPAGWAKPGAVTRLKEVPTSFGPLSLEFRVAKDGRSARLRLTPPRREPPARIVWHLDRWSGTAGTRELPRSSTTVERIELTRR